MQEKKTDNVHYPLEVNWKTASARECKHQTEFDIVILPYLSADCKDFLCEAVSIRCEAVISRSKKQPSFTRFAPENSDAFAMMLCKG